MIQPAGDHLTWIARELRSLARPLAELRPDPRNARRHPDGNLADIERSLRAHGQQKPVVVARDGTVVAGNGTLEVARRLGWTHLAAVTYDGPGRPADFALADNRASDRATYDDVLLAACLREAESLGSLAATGYDDDAFQALLLAAEASCAAAAGEATAPAGDAPAGPQEPAAPALTRPGDLVDLGRHRVLCGDATSSDDVRRLLGERRVDQLLTDPPYGVDLGGGTGGFLAAPSDAGARWGKSVRGDLAVAGDRDVEIPDGYRVFFARFLRLVPWSERNTAYVFMSGAELHHLREAWEDAGLHFSRYLLWVKDGFNLGRGDYHSRHEFLAYGWHDRHEFFGPTNAESTLFFDRLRSNRYHPTQKPLPLVERLVADGSEPGDLVYDPFLGSGTTLLAAEKLGRTCCGLEREPTRVDVLRQRWANRAEEGLA